MKKDICDRIKHFTKSRDYYIIIPHTIFGLCKKKV